MTWQAGQPGRLRIVDLEASVPVLVVDPSDGNTFFLETTGITGEPKDIEVKAVSLGEANAYVTSVISESGSCPLGGASAMSGGCEIGLGDPNNPDCGPGGGGGGSNSHRRVLLTRITLDRSNGFAGAAADAPLELSCASEQGAPGVGELGLALNAARDKAYVVVPDLSQVSVVPINPDGTLNVLSMTAFPTRVQPRDLVLAKVEGIERVLVATHGSGNGAIMPAVQMFEASAPYDFVRQFTFPDSDTLPVSISAHPDNPNPLQNSIFVADYARRQIHVINILAVPDPTITSYGTVGIPGAVAVQGQ